MWYEISHRLSINENANQTGLNQNKKVVARACFDNTSNLLLDLVEKIISIEEDLETGGNPILNTLHQHKEDLIKRAMRNFHLEKYTICFYI